MEKSILLLFCLFVIGTGFAQTRSGKVTYKIKTLNEENPGLQKLKKKDPTMYSIIIGYQRTIKPAIPYLSFQLQFNDSTALFKQNEGMANDNGIDLNKAAIHVRGNGVFYSNLNQNTRLHQFRALEKNWLVKKDIDNLDWKIRDKTKTIQGYKTRKATARINLNDIKKGTITAWFTPELPFSHGPIGYVGLPGLILKLEIRGYAYYADEIHLSDEKQPLLPPTKGELLSWEEYTHALDKRAKQVAQWKQ